MSIEAIYDFHVAMEDPTAEILTACGIETGTPRKSARLQDVRARAELEFQLGQEKLSYHVLPNGEIRNASWNGQMNCYILTPSGDNGADGKTQDASPEHRAYRAKIQSKFAVMKQLLNGTRADGSRYLPCHEIQLIRQVGNHIQYSPKEGYEISRISFTWEFGVMRDAWAELQDPSADEVIISTPDRSTDFPSEVRLRDQITGRSMLLQIQDGQIVISEFQGRSTFLFQEAIKLRDRNTGGNIFATVENSQLVLRDE